LSIPAQADEAKRHRQQQPTSRSIPNVPCLKRHEINGNYYAIKKIRSKIKAQAESGMPLRIENSLNENWASGQGLEVTERRAFNLRASFEIIGQPIYRKFPASSSCPTEASSAETLIFVHDGSELYCDARTAPLHGQSNVEQTASEPRDRGS
jgi:hypothetical protein